MRLRSLLAPVNKFGWQDLALVGVVVFCFFWLVGCGMQSATPTKPTPIPFEPDEPEVTTLLAAWVAPWCGPCKQSIPQVEQKLAGNSKVKFVLYVVSGERNPSQCTQEIADKYAKQYAPSAEAICDNGGKLYREKFSTSSVSIPAGLVQRGEDVELFRAGSQFNPTAIVQAATR